MRHGRASIYCCPLEAPSGAMFFIRPLSRTAASYTYIAPPAGRAHFHGRTVFKQCFEGQSASKDVNRDAFLNPHLEPKTYPMEVSNTSIYIIQSALCSQTGRPAESHVGSRRRKSSPVRDRLQRKYPSRLPAPRWMSGRQASYMSGMPRSTCTTPRIDV